MKFSRKQFNIGLASSLFGLSATVQASTASADDKPGTPSGGGGKPYFFKNPAFEYVFLSSLGRTYWQAGNIGKTLYIMRQIEDGNYESAYQAFKAAADEMRAIADDSASRGHKESARQAYFWAQNYYDSATYFIDGTGDGSRFQPTWELLYACWLKAIALFETPVEHVEIPYEKTPLNGFYFKGKSDKAQRPLLILVNGSDGSMLDMLMTSGNGALARGYDCLVFDGPGQGFALWRQGLHFRPDWEHVITPVVDYALTRTDVDPKRIALQGISQGGYWVPRAVAFEKRIAAAIADPAVVDVSTSWTGTLPAPMIALLKAGRKADFDGYMAKSLDAPTKNDLAFRMRPYGFDSYYDTFKATIDYNLTAVAGQITCPVFIAAPANESFWPGQSKRLFDLLTSPKTLTPFSEADGADLHCEPKGYGLRDLRILNWLDETFA
jgi:hypothetical protein